MSARVMIGVFGRDRDAIDATTVARAEGFRVIDVYTPYAVHGLDRAMGLRPSWLPRVSFALGATGVLLATWFQFWSSAVSWPINVGGRPWNSLPAFVPVIFEVMVLLAGVGTVVVFLVARRLFPGRAPRLPAEGVTNDRFVLVLDASGTGDPHVLRELLQRNGAVSIEEREVEGAA